MPKYFATLTVTIEIEATNACAAKKAFDQDRIGAIRVIGAQNASTRSPSGREPFDWNWNVRITGQKISNLRTAE